MFDHLKQVLVRSFIGAIALGYLLAQAILNFAGIFTAPVVRWTTRRLFQGLVPPGISGVRFGLLLQAALPEAMMFVILIVLWYALLWWLYPLSYQEKPSQPNQSELP